MQKLDEKKSVPSTIRPGPGPGPGPTGKPPPPRRADEQTSLNRPRRGRSATKQLIRSDSSSEAVPVSADLNIITDISDQDEGDDHAQDGDATVET